MPWIIAQVGQPLARIRDPAALYSLVDWRPASNLKTQKPTHTEPAFNRIHNPLPICYMLMRYFLNHQWLYRTKTRRHIGGTILRSLCK